MFSFASRAAMRKAPYVAALAGGAMVTLPRIQQYCQCQEANQVSALRTRSRAGTEKGYSVEMGKTLMKIFHAENSIEGKIDLHKPLDFEEAKHMLTAAGARAKDCRTIFDLIDADHSTSIEFIEIIAFFLERSTCSLQDKASLFFHACDIDDSKKIEAGELKEVVHQMMLLKKETHGASMVEENPILYADIPQPILLHLKANQMVNDILCKASRDGNYLSEKEFQTWLMRGGKEVNQLCNLFGV